MELDQYMVWWQQTIVINDVECCLLNFYLTLIIVFSDGEDMLLVILCDDYNGYNEEEMIGRIRRS